MKTKLVVAALLFSQQGVPVFAFDWASKSIQIEKQYPGDKWRADDPMALNQNMTVEGRGVREPTLDFRVEADLAAGQVHLHRELKVSCDSREIFEAGFDESVMKMPWAVEIHSPCGTWRYTLVDSEKARRAAQGAGIPSLTPASQPRG